MESDSEWDSMSGDEDIEPASISVAVNPPAKLKPDVNPPTHAPHQNLSPLPKSPLSRTNFEAKAPPRTAESYRNMINRGNVQGITSFRDTRDFDSASEHSTGSKKRRDIQTPDKEELFPEIEMREKATKSPKSSKANKKNISALRDSNENLPYTEFEATDMSRHKYKDEPITGTAVQSRPRQEYIVASPAPEHTQQSRKKNSKEIHESSTKRSKNDRRDQARHQKPLEPELPYDNDDEIIVNHNFSEHGAENMSENEGNSRHHHRHAKKVKYEKDFDVDKLVIVKDVYDEGRVEERYLYENGVRAYHSTYTSKTAKMPLLADRVEAYTQRGVQEFFGTLQILVDFVVIFIVELFRFLFRQFGRKLIGGIITVFGDSMLKPVLAALFNNIIQPMFILVWNMMHVFRKLAEPLLMLTREILAQFAMLFKAIRLVSWNQGNHEDSLVKNV